MQSELARLRDMDPIQQVKTLLASSSATAVGEETVDGVPTVHYRGTMPVSTYLEQVDASNRATIKKQLEKDGVKEITSDLWADENYRPHRCQVKTGTSMNLTVDFRHFTITIGYGNGVTKRVSFLTSDPVSVRDRPVDDADSSAFRGHCVGSATHHVSNG